MTREEREDAIDYFKRSYASGNTDDERHHNEVLDMAIKSLEAWESLREELKYELCKKVHEKDSCIPCPNQTTSCSYTGLRIYELNNIINHVIDKHLSEVSE